MPLHVGSDVGSFAGSAPAFEAAARIASPRTRSEWPANASALSAFICGFNSLINVSTQTLGALSFEHLINFPAAISFCLFVVGKRWMIPRTSRSTPISETGLFAAFDGAQQLRVFDFRPVTFAGHTLINQLLYFWRISDTTANAALSAAGA